MYSALGAHEADVATTLLAEQVEERLERAAFLAGRRPHEAAGVVVTTTVKNLKPRCRRLVDPDAHQCLEGIARRPGVGHYPGDDRADATPGDPHQLDHGRL